MPNFISPSIIVSNLCRSKSDTEIDYGKLIIALIKVHFSFMLTDTAGRPLFPGYLCGNVLGRRNHERSSLEEYENAESLPDRVFLQFVRECFQSSDRFATRYFKPTDSMLLYFSTTMPRAVCPRKRGACRLYARPSTDSESSANTRGGRELDKGRARRRVNRI